MEFIGFICMLVVGGFLVAVPPFMLWLTHAFAGSVTKAVRENWIIMLIMEILGWSILVYAFNNSPIFIGLR